MAEVFALDRHNNYIPTMSKEDIIAAIQTAAAGGSFEGFDNCAFITQIKELNRGGIFSIWVGSQAEFNALDEQIKGVLYIIDDDPMSRDLPSRLNKVIETQNGTAETLTKMQNAIKEQRDNNFALSERVTAAEESTVKNAEGIAAVAAANSELKTAADNAVNKVNSLTPQLIYDNSSGAQTCRTTKPITAFNEIVIVFAVRNEGEKVDRTYQERYIAADVGSLLYLRGFWPSTNSGGAVTVDSMCSVKVTKYPNDTLFIIDEKATDKGTANLAADFNIYIKKIYGIGLK